MGTEEIRSSSSPEVIILLIDCSSCPVRGRRCDECVVTAMHQLPVPEVRSSLWEEEDLRVLDVFCEAGLVDAAGAAAASLEAAPYGLRSAS